MFFGAAESVNLVECPYLAKDLRFMKKHIFFILLFSTFFGFARDNNPVFPWWYTDPEWITFGEQY